MKTFVVPAALALVAALLTVVLGAHSMVPATFTEQSVVDANAPSRSAP